MPATPIRRNTFTGSLDLLDEYRRAYALLGAADRVALQATTVSHGYVYEMRRATYAWFNRWFDTHADDDETSQAVETEATLYVTASRFVTTSLRGETALSSTRQLANEIHTPPTRSVDDIRSRVRSVLGIEETQRTSLAARVLATIKKPAYRAEQFEFTSDREIRTLRGLR
jgi:hypothetical protein